MSEHYGNCGGNCGGSCCYKGSAAQFEPSAASYGWHEPRYSAQVGQTWLRDGAGYGFIPLIIGAAGSIAEAAGTIVGAVHEGKQAKLSREHDLKMAKKEARLLREQQELAKIEAQIAAAEASGTKATASWIGGSVLLLGLVGAGIYVFSLEDEEE